MEERESDAEKTEESTEERRKKFREEGNIPNPREIVAAASIAVLLVYFYFDMSSFFILLQDLCKRSWLLFPKSTLPPDELFNRIYFVLRPLVSSLVGLLLALILIPLMVGFVLTQFNWSWKKLEPNFSKLNPVGGIKRMFGMQTIKESIKVILKAICFISIAYVVLKTEIQEVAFLSLYPYGTIVAKISSSLLVLFLSIVIGSFIFSAFDYGFNWWSMEQKMKMTKQELKEDIKSHEGDPMIKGRRRAIAREMAMKRSLSQTARATFIVTNPTHYAVAIRYVKGMNAPVVLAKGQDFLALRIKEIGKKHDIITVENKALARTLYKTVKIGQEVPASLYQPLIEVMKYIYRMRGQTYFERMNEDPMVPVES